jgi:hypothetical protein
MCTIVENVVIISLVSQVCMTDYVTVIALGNLLWLLIENITSIVVMMMMMMIMMMTHTEFC